MECLRCPELQKGSALSKFDGLLATDLQKVYASLISQQMTHDTGTDNDADKTVEQIAYHHSSKKIVEHQIQHKSAGGHTLHAHLL